MTRELMTTGRCLLVALSIWVFSSETLRSNEWRDRFLEQAPQQLRVLEDMSFKLQATVRTDDPDSTADTFFIRDCIFQGPWRLEILRRRPEVIPGDLKERFPSELVRGINASYAFEIHRRTESSTFTITGHEFVRKVPVVKEGPKIRRYFPSLFSTWNIHYRSLHQWLALDGFKILSVEPLTEQRQSNLVRVHAEYKTDEPKDWIRDPDAGFEVKLVMDPDNHWAISSAEYTIHLTRDEGNYGVPSRMEVLLGPSINGLPVPKLVTWITDWPAESGRDIGTITAKYDISNVKKTDDLSEIDFMLTKFGLPELSPNWQESDGGSLVYWVAAGTTLGVTIALIIVFFARRRSKSPQRA